jgi:hypothetical protein
MVRSRRQLLVAAGAAAVALGPGAAVAGALDRKKGIDEPGALTALLTAELHAAFAYERCGLDHGRELARQDGEHARALASLLDALGRTIPRAPSSPEQLQRSAAALLRSPGPSAAAALERALIAGCATQITRVGDPGMVRTIATIMASHAQHLALMGDFHEALVSVPYPA